MLYEQWIAALCIWREARGASLPAMNGVYSVILNRSTDAHARWPRNVPDVITQHLQFSSFNAGDPNAMRFPSPGSASDWKAWLNCQAVVETPIGPDPTQGATNYHSIPEGQPLPAWADPAKLTVEIGPFKFYRL